MGNHLQIQAAVADPDFVPGLHRTLKQLRQQEQQKHEEQVLQYERNRIKLNQLLKRCIAATAALAVVAVAAHINSDSPSTWYFAPAVVGMLLGVWLSFMRATMRQPPHFFLPPEFIAPVPQTNHTGPEDLSVQLLETDSRLEILGGLSLPMCCVISQLYHAHRIAVSTTNVQLLRCALQCPVPLPSGIPIYHMALPRLQRIAALGMPP